MNSLPPPTRIGFAITELDRGGAELAFTRLVRGLNRSLWEPRVFCLSGEGELAEHIRSDGIEVIPLSARGKFDFGLIGRFRRALYKFEPRLLQTFLHHANLAGRFAARGTSVRKVVCGIRVTEQRSRWRLRLDRWTQEWVDQNVCVSQSVASFSETVGGLNSEKLVVIPNGIDIERIRAAPPFNWTQIGFPENSRVILVVGRLDEQKRPLLALESVIPVFARDVTTRLVFCGIGRLREEIEVRTARAGMTDRIRLLGTRWDIPELMRGATLLLHPSAWEGSPNVIWEAHAARLPVITNNIEGNREAINDGEWGTLVSGDSSSSYQEAIEAALRDTDELRKKSLLAFDYCAQNRRWEQMISAYETLYRDLLRDAP